MINDMSSTPSLDALKAAYYKVHDPALTEDQIAGKASLGSQTRVSRLLKEAREHKVLREVSRRRSFGGSPFKRLHVVAAPGIENTGDARIRERAFQSFGVSAAGIVSSYIDELDM